MSSSELQPDLCAPAGGGVCRCKQAKAEASQGATGRLLESLRRLFRPKAPAAPVATGLDLAAVDALIAKRKGHDRGLIELLQDVSEHYRYLPPEALSRISENMNVPLSRLYALATFYQDFKLKPQGLHRLVICTGTACHVKGASAIVEVLCRELNLKPGDTTPDGKLTLSTVNCIGLCGVGPVATLDGKYLSQLTPEKALDLVKTI
jgi:NADH-quinone oxidoreductase subunit E